MLELIFYSAPVPDDAAAAAAAAALTTTLGKSEISE
jgi:hypothetical protein